MFSMTVMPRFYETDALGHINNTVVSGWFETARTPIFQLFNPQMNLKAWNLILARVEIDYVAQAHYGEEVTLLSGIERIGNSSFVVAQEAWQNKVCVARGKAVHVFFDYVAQASGPIPGPLRQALEGHLMSR